MMAAFREAPAATLAFWGADALEEYGGETVITARLRTVRRTLNRLIRFDIVGLSLL